MDVMDWPTIGRFFFALIFVLALMGGLSIVMRRINGQATSLPGRKRRLQIIESLPVDTKRRLLLIRRDGREHLLLLGANGDCVIETGIESSQDKPHDTPEQPDTPQA